MSNSVESIDVLVRYTCGTYQAGRIRGLKSSCTAGPAQAAAALAKKIYGASVVSVTEKAGLARPGTTVWTVHAEEVHAWCMQGGLIEVGPIVPQGALWFARGMDAPLREVINVVARHGKGQYEGRYLVPGVPEADSECSKVEALVKWVEWTARRNGTPSARGVVFGRPKDGVL